jgi:hypothetical protein
MPYKRAGIDVHKKVLMVVVIDATTPEEKPGRRRYTTGGNNVTSTSTTVLASCATYNPTTGTWTAASTLNNARVDHSSTLLHNGHVPTAGGDNCNGELSSAELY